MSGVRAVVFSPRSSPCTHQSKDSEKVADGSFWATFHRPDELVTELDLGRLQRCPTTAGRLAAAMVPPESAVRY